MCLFAIRNPHGFFLFRHRLRFAFTLCTRNAAKINTILRRWLEIVVFSAHLCRTDFRVFDFGYTIRMLCVTTQNCYLVACICRILDDVE